MSLEAASHLSRIDDPPGDPVQLFSELVKAADDDGHSITMNIATLDSEFGVLNRTVNYRGLADGHVTFITERNTRKYSNIKENPKVSVTFFFGMLNIGDSSAFWQVRIFGEAVELNEDQLRECWESEPVFAKIRSRICECGKPVDPEKMREAHDALLKAYQEGEDKLLQTDTYTGFKIIPSVWDFYKAQMTSIADRVMYKRQSASGESWSIQHVAA